MEVQTSANGPWRHRRVWIAPHGLAGQLRFLGIPMGEEGEMVDAVEGWARASRPFVARAWTAAEAERPCDHVPLGLALFPCAGKKRLSFTAPAALVVRSEPPLPLRTAWSLLPSAHARAARKVLAAMEPHYAEVAVYGSAFWSYAAGELRMSDSSDLDLLLRPVPSVSFVNMLAMLGEVAAAAEVRLDGEVLLRDGGAIAWRELAMNPAQVLVKTDLGPELRSLQHAWEQW